MINLRINSNPSTPMYKRNPSPILNSLSRSLSETDLVSPYIKIPENINDLSFDTDQITNKFVLTNIAGHIFDIYLKKLNLGNTISNEHLARFISLIADKYNEVDFHNFQHAVNVLHVTHIFIKEFDIPFDPIVVFGLLISALCHDVDHPGNTNSYEINSMSELAKIYNDTSVLENHHCSLTFHCIEQTELYSKFEESDYKIFRKTIIECILGTDMSKHKDAMTAFDKYKYNKDDFPLEDQYMMAKVILHYADLANMLKPFDTSKKWAKRLSMERFMQMQKEIENGLPFTFCNANSIDVLSLCNTEIAFAANVVIPMWEILGAKFPNAIQFEERIIANLKHWDDLKKQCECKEDFSDLM
jgi:hypothetical protein